MLAADVRRIQKVAVPSVRVDNTCACARTSRPRARHVLYHSSARHDIVPRAFTVADTLRIRAPDATSPHPTQFADANFPRDQEGRTYHLGTKRGEVANRVLSVGSTDRTELLSSLLQPLPGHVALFQCLSSRGFLTVTGAFEGVPVSIVSTHMGMANMDFVVRETRAVVDGQMAVVRLGTCGAVQPPARLGNFLVATHGSVCVRSDPDAWSPEDGARDAYHVSRPVPADATLSAALLQHLAAGADGAEVHACLNASADSFYSSQGRIGTSFDDRNDELLLSLVAAHPDLLSLEMETFQLFHLARCSKGSLRAAAFCIALAERYTGGFLGKAALKVRELAGGRAALAALATTHLEGAPPANDAHASVCACAGVHVHERVNGHGSVNGHSNGHVHVNGGAHVLAEQATVKVAV